MTFNHEKAIFMKNLRIADPMLRRIHALAHAAGKLECMGLLARKPDEDFASVALPLPSESTRASAVAAPLHIAQTIAKLQHDGLVPIGLYHSHGDFAVFHSGTDDETTRRMLPSFASFNFKRRAVCGPPLIRSCDEAILPQSDGYQLRILLTGESIVGTSDRLRLRWAHVSVHYPNDGDGEPQLTISRDTLILSNCDIAIHLRLPAGGAVAIIREENDAVYKVATMFSLVVNNRGDEHCERLVVREIQGESIVELGPCQIERLTDTNTEFIEPGKNALAHVCA